MESGQPSSTLKELCNQKIFTQFGLQMSKLWPMFTKWVKEEWVPESTWRVEMKQDVPGPRRS